MKAHTSNMWLCPLCFKQCKYGTMGCVDPFQCDEPKNINFEFSAKKREKRALNEAKGVGISEIANIEDEDREM